MTTYSTEHYVFHYEPGSPAGKDIASIASGQEACFRHITNCLGVMPKEKIHYTFFDSPEAIGRELERLFGEYMPTNGCTISENEILAVYSSDIHCLGCHEDTHIISYRLGTPDCSFLLEGLACCICQLWWGISNNAWTAYYIEKGNCPSIVSLFSDEEFCKLSDVLTYPIAGSFMHYLFQRFGSGKVLRFYAEENEDFPVAARRIFGCTLETLEADFLNYVKLLSFDPAVFSRIEELLQA